MRRPTPADFARVNAMMDSIIARHGFAVQGVFGDGDRAPLAYTVGLAAKGLPELIMIGIDGDHATLILNTAAQRLMDGTLPLDTPLAQILHPHNAMAKSIGRHAADEYMLAAKRRYPDYTAVQLFWPDPAGSFPWQGDYDPHFYFQTDLTKK